MKTISIYNHKGGVGKTTIAYNLAHALADLGNAVLIADLDPQANLSLLGMDDYENYIETGGWTIATSVLPLITGEGDFTAPQPVGIGNGVTLLPGSIDLASYENLLPSAWTECLAGQPRGFLVTTALGRLLTSAGAMTGADYVLVDLGPNVGGLNRVALLASDYFIVPMMADLFSNRAVRTLGETLKEWTEVWETAAGRARNLRFSLLPGQPHFLGYIAQQYNIYRNRPTKAFEYWKAQMPSVVASSIMDPLQPRGLDRPARDHGAEIGEVKNFHSLVPKAQEARKPIIHLTAADGVIGDHVNTVLAARACFDDMAKNVCDWTA
ncbi:MAG: ParA family protein [Bacteroidota bacterium]